MFEIKEEKERGESNLGCVSYELLIIPHDPPPKSQCHLFYSDVMFKIILYIVVKILFIHK